MFIKTFSYGKLSFGFCRICINRRQINRQTESDRQMNRLEPKPIYIDISMDPCCYPITKSKIIPKKIENL